MVSDALLARRFLLSLSLLLQPPLPEDPPVDPARFDRLPKPHLVGDLRGMVCEFEFVADDELMIALHVRPAAHLHLRREDRVSRFLDKFGLSREAKIGEPAFDEKYLVKDISAKDARAMFNRRVLPLVEKLEPFFALEMLEKQIRVLKYAPMRQGYTPQAALDDLERLLELHAETRKVELPDAGIKH